MLQSMTGFGKADYEDEQLRIQVTVKSINSKYADINLQLPKLWMRQGIAWRNMVSAQLQRGKIELSLQIAYKQQVESVHTIQEPLFKTYYSALLRLAQDIGAPTDSLFKLALKSPGVITGPTEKEEDHDLVAITQQRIETTIHQALLACQQARIDEGNILANNILIYLQQMSSALAAIEQLDTGRLNTFKDKLMDKLAIANPGLPIDHTRLEQELVYYLDKIDITEEKVRLTTHLAYFIHVMAHEAAAGKKLGFIAQEIARELNTLAAKANQAAIQQYTIVMKNELEKIKEQLQNIL